MTGADNSVLPGDVVARKTIRQHIPVSPATLLGLAIVSLVILAAVFASWIFPCDPLRIVGKPLTWPFQDWRFPLGTDALGRDILSGLFHGARISLLIGLTATLCALLIGLTVGALAGYFGGWVDEILMRITEAFQVIPNFIIMLVVISIIGNRVENIMLAIGVASWTGIARLARVQFLAFRGREFVQAARTLGMNDLRIIIFEIAPNALPPVIVYTSVIMAVAILFDAALSYLGLGDPNFASWGGMIGAGQSVFRTAWYISVIPGIAIVLTVLGINLIGSGLNDSLNPLLSSRR